MIKYRYILLMLVNIDLPHKLIAQNSDDEIKMSSSNSKLTDQYEGLVDIGNGHKLFVRQTDGDPRLPTVIFESGAGGGADDLDKVISFLPKNVRILTYDRAGTGKSLTGVQPRTMAQEVYEPHKLLKVLNIKGPIILVGQSIGGLLNRLFVQKYGKDAAGLIMLDPTHESAVLGSMKYGGSTRIRKKAVGKNIPRPQLIRDVSKEMDSTADYMAEEFQGIFLETQKKPKSLAKKPLTIIGAGIRKQPPSTLDAQWKTLRSQRDAPVKELTMLSSRSKFILDPKSSHSVHYDNPQLVAKVIENLIVVPESKSSEK